MRKSIKFFISAVFLTIISLAIVAATTNSLDPVFLFINDSVDVICIDGSFKVESVRASNKTLKLSCVGREAEPTRGSTPTAQPTATDPAPPTQTVTPPPVTPTFTVPAPTGVPGDPFPGAPLCASHNDTMWHGLWNDQLGCHYDHEHGKDPHASPLWSQYIGVIGQEVSYPWQTPNENAQKHYGYKYDWRENLACTGRENSQHGVRAYLIERHSVGDYSVAFQAPFHSSAGTVVICNKSGSGPDGTITVGGWQTSGQRTSPYQGVILGFDYNAQYPGYQPYDAAREPYIALDCVGSDCNRTLQNVTGGSTWIFEPVNLEGNSLLSFLFRTRDAHNVVDGNSRFGSSDNLVFLYVCSDDGGATFRQANCRNNNTTGAVHEIMGEIPNSWDNLDGVVDGRVTFEGHVDRFGNLTTCSVQGPDCIPVKLVNAQVGSYGMQDSGGRQPLSREALPELDIYFCGSTVCTETSPGAVPSGWASLKN